MMADEIDPDVQILLDAAAKSELPPINELTADEARQQYFTVHEKIDFDPVPVGAVEDFTIDGPGGALPMRLYRPTAGGDSLPVVVFYHGGGFVLGSVDSYDGFCRHLCERSGCLVLSVEYRLAPEHRFPAAVDDACAALKWTFENAAAIGGDPAAVAVAGDSAGGTLSAAVCQMARDAGLGGPAAQVLIYPAVDLGDAYPSRRAFADTYPIPKKVIDWFYDHYLGRADAEDDPRAAPIRAERFDGLPPTLVITAGLDPLCDEGEAYADKLRDAGVPVEYKCYTGCIHGFAALGKFLRIATDAMDFVADYLKKTLRPAG